MNSSRTIDAPAPSRRAVIRTAAWSVPVISVAATAPAFAASPLGRTSFTWTMSPNKWSDANIKHVSWDLTIVNGPVAIDTISITFTYNNGGGGSFNAQSFVIRRLGLAADGANWSKTPATGTTPTITATRVLDIAANTSFPLHVDFAGGDNSAGSVSATATITYVGSPATTTVSTGAVEWVSGSEHVGH